VAAVRAGNHDTTTTRLSSFSTDLITQRNIHVLTPSAVRCVLCCGEFDRRLSGNLKSALDVSRLSHHTETIIAGIRRPPFAPTRTPPTHLQGTLFRGIGWTLVPVHMSRSSRQFCSPLIPLQFPRTATFRIIIHALTLKLKERLISNALSRVRHAQGRKHTSLFVVIATHTHAHPPRIGKKPHPEHPTAVSSSREAKSVFPIKYSSRGRRDAIVNHPATPSTWRSRAATEDAEKRLLVARCRPARFCDVRTAPPLRSRLRIPPASHVPNPA
jgi:hypothetical protein